MHRRGVAPQAAPQIQNHPPEPPARMVRTLAVAQGGAVFCGGWGVAGGSQKEIWEVLGMTEKSHTDSVKGSGEALA